jgi:hypothetical protein
MSNVFDFPGPEDKKSAADSLREFADLLDELDPNGVVECAAVALVPEVGVALCGNSETGNDGMNTMFDLGKTAILMQYLNEEYDDDFTVH